MGKRVDTCELLRPLKAFLDPNKEYEKEEIRLPSDRPQVDKK